MRWAQAYLTAQAVAVPAWWLALAASPAVRARFELDPDNRAVLNAYLPSDLLVLAAGSLYAAHHPKARAAVATAWATSTLTLAGWVRRTGHGKAGLPPMLLATAITAATTRA